MLGSKVAVLVDKWDFSGSFFSVETEHTVEEKDNTTFGALAVSAEPGLASDKLMLRGYYSSYAAGSVYRELRTRMGTAGAGLCMALLIDTDDANEVAECSPDAWGKNLKTTMAAKELITFELNTADASDMAAGLVLWRGEVTATGTKTGVTFPAPGVAGGLVFVFVSSITGTATNAQVVIESSVPGAYATEATMTFSATGGYSAAMTGNVGSVIRANIANLGGATAVTLTVIACVKGVTY